MYICVQCIYIYIYGVEWWGPKHVRACGVSDVLAWLPIPCGCQPTSGFEPWSWVRESMRFLKWVCVFACACWGASA